MNRLAKHEFGIGVAMVAVLAICGGVANREFLALLPLPLAHLFRELFDGCRRSAFLWTWIATSVAFFPVMAYMTWDPNSPA